MKCLWLWFDGNEKQETFEDGIERGIEQKTIEDAKAMLEENCNVDLICRVTKLSLNQVERLKEEIEIILLFNLK